MPFPSLSTHSARASICLLVSPFPESFNFFLNYSTVIMLPLPSVISSNAYLKLASKSGTTSYPFCFPEPLHLPAYLFERSGYFNKLVASILDQSAKPHSPNTERNKPNAKSGGSTKNDFVHQLNTFTNQAPDQTIFIKLG